MECHQKLSVMFGYLQNKYSYHEKTYACETHEVTQDIVGTHTVESLYHTSAGN